MTFGGRLPTLEDDLRREDGLWWKMTFIGRQPLVEDEPRWKATFGGRQTSLEDNLQWKTTFDGRRPLVVTPLLDN